MSAKRGLLIKLPALRFKTRKFNVLSPVCTSVIDEIADVRFNARTLVNVQCALGLHMLAVKRSLQKTLPPVNPGARGNRRPQTLTKTRGTI